MMPAYSPIPSLQSLIFPPQTNTGQQESERAQKGQPRQTKEGIAEEIGLALGQKPGPKVVYLYFTSQRFPAGPICRVQANLLGCLLHTRQIARLWLTAGQGSQGRKWFYLLLERGRGFGRRFWCRRIRICIRWRVLAGRRILVPSDYGQKFGIRSGLLYVGGEGRGNSKSGRRCLGGR